MNEYTDELIKAIRELAKAHAVGMEQLSESINSLATRVKYLGTGKAASDMGAIEYFATKVEHAGGSIAEAIREATSASPT
jgi:methyl-accepting chemotaxis protein